MARTVKPNKYGMITSCPKDVKEVVIPAGVTKIDRWAFSGCRSLSSITFGGTKKEWKAVEKGENWHEGVPAKGVECSDGMVKFGLFG